MSQQSLVRAGQRAAALLAAAVLASCANMLTGNDVTQSISTEVTAANAKTSEITVRIDPAMNGGTISAPGFKSVQKVGIPFNLSVDVGTNFAFKGWTVLGDGSLKIIDASVPATSATVYKTAWKEPTIIQANFFRRPTLTINPINGGEVVNRNRKILLRFDHAMAPSTLLLPDSVMVEENAMTNGSGWADVTKTYFSEILPNDQAGMEYYLAFASNKTLLKPYTYYKITVLKQVTDTNGVTMVDDVVSQFSTGASADNSPPSITTYIAASAATPDTNRATTLFTNASTVYLSVTAIDDSGSVPTLTIQELFGSDPANPLKSRSNTMTTTAGYFEYLLNTVWGEGPRTLAVQGTDSIGNLSAATEKNAQVLVFYDTTKPVISSFPLKGLTNSVSQTLNLSASDSQGSGLASYALTGDVATGQVKQVTEAGSTQLAFALPAGDGPKKITLTVTDKAGNTSEESKTLVLDTLAPQAPSLPAKILGRPDAFNASESSTQFRVSFAEDVQIGDSLAVALNGKPLSVTTLGPTAIAERSQVLTVNADSLGNDGILTLTSQITDQAGNAGPDSPALTLLKDVGLPTLVLGSLSTNNSADSSFARNGNQVSLTFTPTDVNLTGTATVVIGGVSQTVPLVSGTPTTVRHTLGANADGLLDYSVGISDTAGNTSAATTGAQGSVTIDNTVPLLELGTFSSSNASNSLFAKDGDTITLNFRLTEANLDPAKLTGTFVGKPANIIPLGGGNYKASLKVLADWNLDNSSYPVAYSITAVDRAGNTSTAKSGALGSVTIDFSQPDFAFKSLVSNNPGSPTQFAKVGETVTMQFTATAQGSALTNVKGVIAGHEVAATALGGNLYEASYKLTSTDSEGPVTYQMRASNQTGRVFTTNYSDPSDVVFDRTAPQVTVDSFLSNNGTDHSFARRFPSADTLTLKFTAQDPHLVFKGDVTIAGIALTLLGLSTGAQASASVTPSTLPDGAVTYSISVSDLAGNTTTISQLSPGTPQITADNTAPTVTAVTLSSSNPDHPAWAKKDDVVTVSFTVNDANGTDPEVTIAGMTASITAIGGNQYSAKWTVKNNDTQDAVAFVIKAGDRAGNLTTFNSGTPGVTITGSVSIDTIAPEVVLGSFVSNNVNPQYARSPNSASLTVTGTDTHLAAQGEIMIGGAVQTVDFSTPGTKTATQLLTNAPEGLLSYRVTLADLAGNITTKSSGATSTITVDNIKPMISLGAIVSDNSTNPAFAKKDDHLTVSFTGSDTNWNKVDATIVGHALTMTGADREGFVTITSSDDAQPIDYLLTATDFAGNTTTISGSRTDITIDTTAPTLSFTNIVSNNVSPSWAKSGNTLTFTFTGSDTHWSHVAATVAGHNKTVTGASRSDSVTVADGDDQVGVPYTLIATDLAGNSTTVSATKTGITIDTVKPTLSLTSLVSDNSTNTAFAKTGDTLTFTFAGSDTHWSQVAATVAGHSKTVTGASRSDSVTVADGDDQVGVPYTLVATDQAGNATTVSSTKSGITIDTIKPTLAFTNIVSNNASSAWAKTGNTLTFTFTGSDDNWNQVAATVAGHNKSVTGANRSGSVTVADGDDQVGVPYTLVATDQAGNSTTVSSTHPGITIDTVKPTLSLTSLVSDNSTNTAFAKTGDTLTFTFAGSDTHWSQVAATVAGHSKTVTGASRSDSVTVADGDDQVGVPYTLVATDLAGNSTTVTDTQAGITIDTVKPTLAFTNIVSSNASSLWAKTGDTLTFTFTGSDTNWNQVAATIAGHSKSVTGANRSGSVTVADGDDQVGVPYTLVATDQAGNSTTVTDTQSGITIDTVKPILAFTNIVSNNASSAWAKTGNTLTFTFTGSDDNWEQVAATVAGHTKTVTGVSRSGSVTVADGDDQVGVPYTLVATDLAGNSTTVTDTQAGITIDTVKPILAFTNIVSNNASSAWAKTGNTLTFTFTGSDDNWSQVAAIVAGHTKTVTGVSRSGSVTVADGDDQVGVPYTLVATDQAGNSTTVTDTQSGITIDTIAPTITVAGPTYPDNVTAVYTVTTSYVPAGYSLTVANLTISEAVTPVITDASAATATVTFTNPIGVGSISFSVKAGIVADLAGNLNAATGYSSVAAYSGNKFTGYTPPGGYLAGERTLPGTKSRFSTPAAVSPAPTLWAMVTEAFLPPASMEIPAAAPVPVAPPTPVTHQAAWLVTPTSPIQPPLVRRVPAPAASVTAPLAADPAPAPAPQGPSAAAPAPTVPPTAQAPSPAPVPVSSPSLPAASPVASAPVSTAPTNTAPPPSPLPERAPTGYPPLWNQIVEERRMRKPGLV